MRTAIGLLAEFFKQSTKVFRFQIKDSAETLNSYDKSLKSSTAWLYYYMAHAASISHGIIYTAIERQFSSSLMSGKAGQLWDQIFGLVVT